jgi:hypothetical protein
LALLLTSGVTALAQAACDRACLKATLDQYLNAVIKHDPAAAPLMVGFRQTDNAVAIRLGTGVWQSVTALGKVQRRYYDPVSGQAAYFGTVMEGAKPAIATVRVKVEDRKISEAEWYLAREGDPGMNGPAAPGQPAGNFFDPENLAMNPPPDRVVPRAERASRASLIAITNSYFDGITAHDGTVIQAHPGCVRLENGFTVTGRPAAGKGKDKGGATTDCTSNLATINISLVAARRYPVVDEEAQVVLALAVFLRKPGTPQRRNVFSEWFAIDGNRIRSIWAAMFYPPDDVPVPNWPPYDGNWPPPAHLAAPPPGR